MWKQIFLGSGAVVALANAAFADGAAVTTGDVNLRAGPGTGFSVISVTPSGQTVTVHGCTAGGAWCAINSGGLEGWSNARLLAVRPFPGAMQAYYPGSLATDGYTGRSAGPTAYAFNRPMLGTTTYAYTGPILGPATIIYVGTYPSAAPTYPRWGKNYGQAGW
jgi:uncharacterized protein YraI